MNKNYTNLLFCTLAPPDQDRGQVPQFAHPPKSDLFLPFTCYVSEFTHTLYNVISISNRPRKIPLSTPGFFVYS